MVLYTTHHEVSVCVYTILRPPTVGYKPFHQPRHGISRNLRVYILRIFRQFKTIKKFGTSDVTKSVQVKH